MESFERISQGMDVQALAKKRKRYITMMVALGIFGGGLYGYTLAFLSGALVTMNFDGSSHPLDSWSQSIITATMVLGCAIGAYFGGTLADKFGRKTLIFSGAVISLVGALACALAGSIVFFSIARFVVGFGVGVTSCVIPVYLGEMAPTAHRGRLVSVNTAMITVCQFLASVVNAILSYTADWHAMVWASVIPAVLFTIVMFFVKDTPNYLARHGMDKEAVEILLETRPEAEAKETFESIVNHTEAQKSSGEKVRFSDPWVRRVLLAGIGAALINQLVGTNAINYFAPTILSSTLGIDASNSIISSLPIMAVCAIAALVGGLGLMDRIGRRPMLTVGLVGVVACQVLIGVCYLFIDPKHPSTTMSWLLIGVMMVFVAFIQGVISPTTWSIIAEVFPDSIRGTGVAYANVAMNVANFAISLFFLPLLNAVGGAGTFFIFAVINVGSIFFTRAFIPETRGKTLEQIEQEARARVK